VHTFALSGHATANTCYASSAPVGDTHNRRFFAVLKLGPVRSARDAVRASIVQAYREETKAAVGAGCDPERDARDQPSVEARLIPCD
jgi:hypothetical protein